MKPILEKIVPETGTSFFIDYSNGCCCDDSFWHVHPEYELVYIDSGSSKRHVGTHVSTYEDGELIMIGSNVPHSSLGNSDNPDNVIVVIQMGVHFVEQQLGSLAELNSVSKLFKRSFNGISFGKQTKQQMGPILKEMKSMNAFDRFTTLIKVLNELSRTKDYQLLLQKSAEIQIQSNDYQRIQLINEFVSEHFASPIKLKTIAELTHLTESSFSRFFKNVTGKTFSSYLTEFRIHKACDLLANKNTTISEVMHASGFTELAHFSRTFKKITKQSPSDYRKEIRFW